MSTLGPYVPAVELTNYKIDSLERTVNEVRADVVSIKEVVFGDEDRIGLATIMPVILRLMKWAVGLAATGVATLIMSAGGIYWNLLSTWAAAEAATDAAAAAEETQEAFEEKLLPALKKSRTVIVQPPRPAPVKKPKGFWPWD